MEQGNWIIHTSEDLDQHPVENVWTFSFFNYHRQAERINTVVLHNSWSIRQWIINQLLIKPLLTKHFQNDVCLFQKMSRFLNIFRVCLSLRFMIITFHLTSSVLKVLSSFVWLSSFSDKAWCSVVPWQLSWQRVDSMYSGCVLWPLSCMSSLISFPVTSLSSPL